jgi:microcystin-dependent protein
MSEPFIGEIKLVSFNFAPRGWAPCNGQLMPINQYQALFSLLGTYYGGDGRTNFALPDLRDRAPVHQGQGFGGTYPIGERGGEATHTVAISELPSHSHLLGASSAPGTHASAIGNVLAASTQPSYAEAATTSMNPGAVGPVGGLQAHENRPPLLVLNFVIALQGIFPSQN